MERELKFRAWDVTETMTFFELTPKGMLKGIPNHLRDIFLQEEGYWLMQFTGLKDKDGIEIYEGDIVQYKESEQGKEAEFYYTKKQIQFHNGSFGFEGWTTDIKFNLRNENTNSPSHFAKREFFYVKFDIEVIGNIHENSELLK